MTKTLPRLHGLALAAIASAALLACGGSDDRFNDKPAGIGALHTQHYVMLQRNLLYTGLTRGKKLVVIVGTEKAVGLAVRNAEAGRRNTTLRKRLREAFGTA